MKDHRVEKLRSIQDEVKEFHPLLNVLFRKLTDIVSVDYRQGNSEMGADFILTKKDNTLGGTEYIGAVVKIGKITQSHSEVERQIEECDIERTVEGGKKKIYLTEIWVIASGTITQNAREKIHNKYKSKKIKFIDQDMLITLIDTHCSEFWNNVTIEENEYLNHVRETSKEITHNNGMGFYITDNTYVPQSLIKIDNSKSIYKLTKPRPIKRVDIHEAIRKERLILIEAMMGSGKSTLLGRAASYFSNSENFVQNETLPILIDAIDLYDDHSACISNLITTTLTKFKLKPQKMYLIMIDAMDELRITNEDRLAFLSSIRESVKNQDNIKIVITSRNFDDPELEAELDGFFTRYQLCPFTVPQVLDLVKTICQDSSAIARLEKDLDRSQVFKALPRTPISAILLARILKENIQEIPSTMTDLYAKYMELVLGRWDMQKGLQSQIEYDITNNTVINIAEFAIENSLIHIPAGDAKSIYNDYVNSRKFQIEKEKLFEKIISKNEVFIYNRQKKTISFRHRTFAEFFYAQALSRDNKATINEEIYDMYWSSSYFFYLGIKRDCPEIINAIDNIDLRDEKYRFLKIIGHGGFLLAAYLTPYIIITRSVESAFHDAANLYQELIEQKTESPLQQFSAIQLLCIISHCLNESYGYDYFAEAIKERALDLFSRPDICESGMVELFLLNSVLVKTKDNNAHDLMIEQYGKKIPLALQAAIVESTGEQNKYSQITERFSKRFIKQLKGNRNMQIALSNLYEKAIKDQPHHSQDIQ
ncbi:NACHT domain-containing protein [Billgrantia antri]|uniref:NACHT C-terminal Helical domain-containing protein n=1 Tax=Billgrantia antri TaxID=2846777 RepID=A0ABS6ZL15_9GAMM|nr:hypothetical protein [Halomonas antri]MBW6390458.1 hypothetical protein [Halomonas antri]